MPAISETLSKTILALVHLENLEGPEAVRRVHAILDDTDMLNIGAKLAARAFVVEALREAGPAQLAKLVKRTAPPPSLQVKFILGISPRTGFVLITATLENPGAVSGVNSKLAEEMFDGPPENLLAWEFRGHRPPRDIAERYAKMYEPHAAISNTQLHVGKSKAELADAKASHDTLDRQQIIAAEKPRYMPFSDDFFKALEKTPAELAEEKASAETLARQRKNS